MNCGKIDRAAGQGGGQLAHAERRGGATNGGQSDGPGQKPRCRPEPKRLKCEWLKCEWRTAVCRQAATPSRGGQKAGGELLVDFPGTQLEAVNDGRPENQQAEDDHLRKRVDFK